MVISSPLSDFLALWSSHCQVNNRPHEADSADPDYQNLLFYVARGNTQLSLGAITRERSSSVRPALLQLRRRGPQDRVLRKHTAPMCGSDRSHRRQGIVRLLALHNTRVTVWYRYALVRGQGALAMCSFTLPSGHSSCMGHDTACRVNRSASLICHVTAMSTLLQLVAGSTRRLGASVVEQEGVARDRFCWQIHGWP